jgi:hypothetical protein
LLVGGELIEPKVKAKPKAKPRPKRGKKAKPGAPQVWQDL